MVPRLFAPIFSNEGGGFSVIGRRCLFSFKSDKYRVVPRRFPPLLHRCLAVRQGRFLVLLCMVFVKFCLRFGQGNISQEGGKSSCFSTACQRSDAGKRLRGYRHRIYTGLRGIEYCEHGAWRNFHGRCLYRPASGNGSGNEYFPRIGRRHDRGCGSGVCVGAAGAPTAA